jgi:hypothetical protein
MEKVMSSFEYEPLVLSLELETLDDEEDKRDKNGTSPSCTRITKEPRNLKGGKDSLGREAIEQIVE